MYPTKHRKERGFMAKAWFEATVTKRFKGIINDSRLALHEGEILYVRKYGQYGVMFSDGGSRCGTISANFARQHLRLGKRLSTEESARLEERVQAILRERAQQKNPSAFSAVKK
jgi:hypothetical protein